MNNNIINDNVFCNQWPIVLKFVQSYIYYKELYKQYNAKKMQSAFCAKTIDAHLEIASIEWCNVFGADGEREVLICNEKRKCIYVLDVKNIISKTRLYDIANHAKHFL